MTAKAPPPVPRSTPQRREAPDDDVGDAVVVDVGRRRDEKVAALGLLARDQPGLLREVAVAVVDQANERLVLRDDVGVAILIEVAVPMMSSVPGVSVKPERLGRGRERDLPADAPSLR